MNRGEFYNTLSEDVKNKIKACKTEEEMLKVLGQEGIALNDELLDSVSGGEELVKKCQDKQQCGRC